MESECDLQAGLLVDLREGSGGDLWNGKLGSIFGMKGGVLDHKEPDHWVVCKKC